MEIEVINDSNVERMVSFTENYTLETCPCSLTCMVLTVSLFILLLVTDPTCRKKLSQEAFQDILKLS